MKFVKIFRYAGYIFLAVILLVVCSFLIDRQTIFDSIDSTTLSWKLIVALILGLYDVIARLIPTVNDWSWLSWIIKLISFLNDFLNRKKK